MTFEIHGFCDERFAPLKAAFAENFADGLEVGASLGVALQGEPVAHLWAGHADFARTRPWNEDTIVVLNSTTKVLLLVCVLMLVDRGLIALDTPVADYWPEFAAGGKDKVTIRDVLTHQGGVPGLDPPASAEDHRDWATITARIAAEPHWFGGERRIAYHPVNTGFILGEVMRRVDGRTPARFAHEEVAQPWGIDLQIGVREPGQLPRLAEVGSLSPPPDAPPFGALGMKVLASIPRTERHTWETLRAEFPSGNAFGNGQAVARLGAILANGGLLEGERVLSEAIVREAISHQVEGEDLGFFGPMRLGLVLSLHSEAFPMPSPTSVYWGGSGGSLCVMDPRTGFSFGFAMNNFILAARGEDRRFDRLWSAITETLAGLPSL